MSTTSILPPYPPGRGGLDLQQEGFYSLFNEGDFVLMRSSRISKQEIKKFHDLYGKTLPLETWWSYISRDYNKQIEFAKDFDDDTGYYMFHTKYIGRVKQKIGAKNHYLFNSKNQGEMNTPYMYIVEWEVRDQVMPGESQTRIQEHYAENLIGMAKMSILTKEEILEDVLKAYNTNQ